MILFTLMPMKRLIDEVAKEIKPSEEEEKQVLDRINSVLIIINKGLKNAKAILGGSGAKGTWLKGLHDIDIFVRFDYKHYKDKNGQLSDILLMTIKKTIQEYKEAAWLKGLFSAQGRKFYF